MTEQIPQKSNGEVASDRDMQVNVMGVGAVQSEVFLRRSSLPRPSEAEIERLRAELKPKDRVYTHEEIEAAKKAGQKVKSGRSLLVGRKYTADIDYHGRYQE